MKNYQYDYSVAEPDESRRHDVAVQARIQELIEAKSAAFTEAEKLINQALEILTSVPLYNIDDPIYDRNVNRVLMAKSQIESDKKYVTSYTDTYLQNLAASRYGEVVKKEMENTK